VERWEDEKGIETVLPQKIHEYRIQREMKKTDTQFQTLTKQRETIPRNPTKLTRTPWKKKSCKKSLRISWRCY
jgi:hypothetical protein